MNDDLKWLLRCLSRTVRRLWKDTHPHHFIGYAQDEHYGKLRWWKVWTGRRPRTKGMLVFTLRCGSNGCGITQAYEHRAALDLIRRARRRLPKDATW